MTPPRLLIALAAAALVQPPVAAEARVLTVPSCGGAAHRTMLPGDPADPGPRRDCAKACHAVTDRRVKPVGGKRDCC